jgi:anaerobic magnesium-protoporphyrin IX monomethyl ester cyclase
VRVLFIEVDTERSWAVASMGPAFIAAYLRDAGHQVEFLRAPVDADPAAFADQVAATEPGLIGVSLTTRQWLRGRELAHAIRARVSAPLIAGGLHATFAPEAVLDTGGFDYVCLGEGEEATLELVRALEDGGDPTAIANIWGRGGARPRLRPPLSPIDALPFLARDLLDEPPGVVHMATQRGCPFPCTYCAARMYDQLYDASGAGDYGRRRTHASCLAELRGLREAGKLAYVIFLDDTFTIHHPWVREFCRVYGDELGAPFSLHARVETVNQKLLEALAAAGCSQITYGVESGSERVRRDIMRRPVSNQRIEQVFAWTREAGIAVTANYMLGLPGETPDDLDQTLALAERLEVLDFGYFVFYPYPGTQLFHVCRERGYLPDDWLERPANHRASILTMPELPAAHITRVYDGFTELRRRRYRALGHDPGPPDGAPDHVTDLARTG